MPRGSYLQLLVKDLPEDLLVDSAWLEKKGIARNLRAYYVKSGWLDQPVRGVYRRPRGTLSWQQVVISLQNLLGRQLVVGGNTALGLHGFEHYVSAHAHTVHLYGPDKPPSWLTRLDLPQHFDYRNSSRLFRDNLQERNLDSHTQPLQNEHGSDFEPLYGNSLTSKSWGQWSWPLTISRMERAYLEVLDDLPKRERFEDVDQLMKGARRFDPGRLQKLLVECRSVKVKRLFFFFADRHKHSWLEDIDKDAIDFGHGNRMLFKGGRLDPEYLITVPENIDAD